MNLVAAGNVLVPAILLIRELGYQLRFEEYGHLFIANKDGNSFIAPDPITLLGLIKISEIRGEQWHASDEEIERIMREFGLLDS